MKPSKRLAQLEEEFTERKLKEIDINGDLSRQLFTDINSLQISLWYNAIAHASIDSISSLLGLNNLNKQDILPLETMLALATRNDPNITNLVLKNMPDNFWDDLIGQIETNFIFVVIRAVNYVIQNTTSDELLCKFTEALYRKKECKYEFYYYV